MPYRATLPVRSKRGAVHAPSIGGSQRRPKPFATRRGFAHTSNIISAFRPCFFARSAERAWPDSPTAPGGPRAILPTSCRHPLRHCGRNANVPKILKGSEMVDHETRRKIIRQWMSLPKDKRQTPEQAADFARKAVEQNELQPSRRDPYERVVSWLLPRTGRSHTSARRQG